MPRVPTRDETYMRLQHHLKEAQAAAAMLAHLHRAQNDSIGSRDSIMASGWLAISEALRLMQQKVIEIATGAIRI